MAKKLKSPSLAKVAKTYKKNTEKTQTYEDQGMYRLGIGSSLNKNKYTPKATDMTYGGTRKGKGTTVKKLGKAKS